MDYAERLCKATETHINRTEKAFQDQLNVSRNDLEVLQDNITSLFSELPDLNNLVCDGRGDLCDSQCGGGGCGSCGGSIACEDGAKQLAETAWIIANDTEAALHEKEALANDFIRNVSQINTNATKNICQQTYDKAQQAFNNSNQTLASVRALETRIIEFRNQNNSTPKDVKARAEEILTKNIQLKPEEIKGLAEKIREKVRSLKNIKSIINETAADSEKVRVLKENADRAK